jgi:hypothetical protein
MSWILGAISTERIKSDIILSSFGEIFDYKYETEKIKLYAGSLSENLYFHKNKNDDKKGWVVAGIGLQSNIISTHILQKEEWKNILERDNKSEIIKNLDGHFIVVEWNGNSISFYSDVLGLRDIYVAQNRNIVLFSTNVVWLSKLLNMEIDFSEFGSRWLLFNQISHRSIFKGIHRIVAGKSATISLNEKLLVDYSEFNWLPSNTRKQFGIEEYSSKLNSLININLPKEKHLSLSLSGGMDSRVILSFLLLNRHLTFDTHTFGNPAHPDSIIAKEITENLNIHHEQFNAAIPAADNIIEEIGKYTSETLVNNPASSFLQLRNYSFIFKRNVVLIDGGFGEIWRREFFYKLYLQGKNALLERNTKKIIPYLLLQRADIFTTEVIEQMMKGVDIQLNELFANLPNIEIDSLMNWLDLFAIKTRLTNYYAHEQTRLDNYLISVMPFIQPSMMKDLLNMEVYLRTNGKLFRKIIRNNAPILERFDLAKGKSTHPYFLSTFQSRLYGLVKEKLKLNKYHENDSHALLNSLKEYIYDIVYSKYIKETSYYDYLKIKKIVESYYKGDTTYAKSLDWWLSFELFRQNISSTRN